MNLGLGLYFSRMASQAQGGDLWVEESALLPAIFCLRLPSAGLATASVATDPLGAHAPDSGLKRRSDRRRGERSQSRGDEPGS